MSETDVTGLLQRWSAGDHKAFDELLPLVYGQLRRLAAAHVSGERRGYTLQPTALVHEAYLRMVQQHSVSFDNRLRFYGAAAQTMRRVLCDRARRRKSAKRGGGAAHSPIEDLDAAVTIGIDSDATTVDLEHLDTALEALEQFDARKARIVELRYFAGLSIADTATALDLSPATIKREWVVARAWLAGQLKQLRERQE
jgi:RNA polymerase sigma factor (TIGR02999 family)